MGVRVFLNFLRGCEWWCGVGWGMGRGRRERGRYGEIRGGMIRGYVWRDGDMAREWQLT